MAGDMHSRLISRRQALSAMGAAALAMPALLRAAHAPAKPNFLFILADDLGYMDLGCDGSTFHETPRLDAFAAGAMRFTQAYAAPVCSPTRAAMLTGKHPARLNITDWIPGQRAVNTPLQTPQILNQLPLDETTIAEALKARGYRTFFAGKWHLGGQGFLPDNQGFDINKGGHNAGQPRSYYAPYMNPYLPDGPAGEYLTDRLANETMQFIEVNREGPFAAFLWFYTVHTPIQACKRHIEKFTAKAAALPEINADPIREGDGTTRPRQDNPAYASMVHAMDENVGRVLDKLKELKLDDNTVVIFTSDNGGLSTLARGAGPTCNLPLRAGKGWCYEGGIRIPLIIRAPGVTKAGQVCDAPVTAMDFYPTMLQLAGLPLMPEQHVDGATFLPLLKGDAKMAHAPLWWHYPHYHGSAWKPGAAVREGDWKLIEFYEEGRCELYNLAEDPYEKRDLAPTNARKRDQMRKLLAQLQQAAGARMPVRR